MVRKEKMLASSHMCVVHTGTVLSIVYHHSPTEYFSTLLSSFLYVMLPEVTQNSESEIYMYNF
jgi:NDP-sugar pyrophosphorylase family protein